MRPDQSKCWFRIPSIRTTTSTLLFLDGTVVLGEARKIGRQDSASNAAWLSFSTE